ncbi:fimbrial protein [Acinetobacter sp. P8-3-8]|uniref:fimbrial protein n=1 Tax=Acinetobacter sp. P8-3-8 TaxID=1029823 RepID=UPI0002488075|nr:fimbrial protein [Acinetobacter sp. P8-3-8]
MFKYKILFALCTLPASYSAFACNVGSSFTSGYTMPTMSASTTNINKYETSSIQSNVFSRGVATVDASIFRVYDSCSLSPKYMRTTFGTIFNTNVTQFSSDIYRLNSNPALGVKVEMGDAPMTASLKVVNAIETPIYDYDGDSHGLKIRVTLYVLPKTAAMTSYPSTININKLQVATISLKRTSNGALVATTIPVYLTATVNISESTCTLTPTDYTINLSDVSIRQLGLPGSETSLSNNTATLSVNCANLNNGGGREIKAYMTDTLNQSNAGNILQNQTGTGYATGVGIRLRDKNDAIISLDPNQSETTNKWTFGNMNTSTIIQHVIKANYVRTSNKVTPGTVRAQAYLNIVYD